MLGSVFIAKVYIDSNIEIEIEVKVIMYYFQSLKWKRKKKKKYGLDFSFKYLQKRNIRKEKQEEHNHPHQLAIARWLGSIHHLRKTIPIPIQIPIQVNTIPSVARYRSTPSVIPKSKCKATLRHHSQLQEKTPHPPTRYTNRRILSPLPPFP